MDRFDDISRLIASVRSVDATRMLARATRSAWPGGAADVTRPAALEWVRRWRPRHPVSGDQIPACACATGRCLVCN
jgi:hypothetical protein